MIKKIISDICLIERPNFRSNKFLVYYNFFRKNINPNLMNLCSVLMLYRKEGEVFLILI